MLCFDWLLSLFWWCTLILFLWKVLEKSRLVSFLYTSFWRTIFYFIVFPFFSLPVCHSPLSFWFSIPPLLLFLLYFTLLLSSLPHRFLLVSLRFLIFLQDFYAGNVWDCFVICWIEKGSGKMRKNVCWSVLNYKSVSICRPTAIYFAIYCSMCCSFWSLSWSRRILSHVIPWDYIF